jgi:PIN domain nuclease of toxin-antitoxin system
VIVLDTHVWVWWLSKPEKITRKAERAITKADRIGVPAICAWEVAMKAEAKKLRFDRPYEVWIEEALTADARIELVPLLPRMSVEAVRLSWDHPEPADRMIVASARVLEAPLITSDQTIHEARLVRCIWD